MQELSQAWYKGVLAQRSMAWGPYHASPGVIGFGPGFGCTGGTVRRVWRVLGHITRSVSFVDTIMPLGMLYTLVGFQGLNRKKLNN